MERFPLCLNILQEHLKSCTNVKDEPLNIKLNIQNYRTLLHAMGFLWCSRVVFSLNDVFMVHFCLS